MNSQSWTCTKGVTSFGGAFPGNRSLFIFPSVRLHSVARTNSCERTAASSISASSGSAFFYAVREGTEIAPDGIVQGFAKLGDVLQLIDATPVLPDTAGIDVVRKRAQHCSGAPILIFSAIDEPEAIQAAMPCGWWRPVHSAGGFRAARREAGALKAGAAHATPARRSRSGKSRFVQQADRRGRQLRSVG